MKKLSKYLIRNKSLLVFILLELVSLLIFLYLKKNKQNLFLNPLKIFITTIDQKLKSIKNYAILQEENELLIEKIIKLKLEKINSKNDTASLPKSKYEIIPVKVINNSIKYSKNYITINKGHRHGLKVDMGVIGINGIVGKIKYTSQNYSTIISLLNTRLYTSAKTKKTNIMGTIQWQGLDSTKVSFLYIPKYAKIKIGDEIITSGYNAIFPEGILIGKVCKVVNKKNKLFYEIDVHLYNNFIKLNNIYVIKNKHRNEIKLLEKKIKNYYE